MALNVKRHQLRRALQALRANGEIAPSEAKRKPLVGHNGENLVRATNPMEVIEMRIAIEPFLARLAALRASPFEMAAIDEAATTAAGADSGAADLKFHKLIAASSGNKLAASLYDLLRRVASDARVRLNVTDRPVRSARNSATPSIAPSRKRFSLAIRTRRNGRCGCISQQCRSW